MRVMNSHHEVVGGVSCIGNNGTVHTRAHDANINKKHRNDNDKHSRSSWSKIAATVTACH